MRKTHSAAAKICECCLYIDGVTVIKVALSHFCIKFLFSPILYANSKKGVEIMGHRTILDRITLLLVIIGALNWLTIGLFQIDLVAMLFMGQGSLISRIIYSLVGLSGVYCISLLFRSEEYSESVQ